MALTPGTGTGGTGSRSGTMAGTSILEYQKDCPCPRQKCERHNRCRECHAYHGAKGKLPRCLR